MRRHPAKFRTWLPRAFAALCFTLCLPVAMAAPGVGQQNLDAFPASDKYCLSCHQGIEPSRPFGSGMMKEIFDLGAQLGDPNGCVVCHAGTPDATADKTLAHQGTPQDSKLSAFTPVPGAFSVNEQTCGQCHENHVAAVSRSIMETDAGKIKTILWSWGLGTENHDHIYANHARTGPADGKPLFGTDTYIAYMKDLSSRFPGQFPSELKKLPEVDLSRLEAEPQQAAYTQLRNCNSCHLSGKGQQDRGHFRGMGCSACHSLYSIEGYYEGGDPSIPKDQSGHVMTHAMQGTRHSPITVNGKQFSGIQVTTCASCHSGGRRIGHSYQGFMPYGHGDNRGPFDDKAQPQQANSGYVFKFIQRDAHHTLKDVNGQTSGMLCQDCHTSGDNHGDGTLGATNLAAVETRCTDCHGTPQHYPWELPLGYGDEFGRKLDMEAARGVASGPLQSLSKQKDLFDAQDGYLLSARGNPLGNVVRKGNRVIIHSANGHDFELTTLKEINLNDAWKNPDAARTAMVNTPAHIEKMECYACHATWAPQYYGYSQTVDYTQQSVDWVNSAAAVGTDGTTADRSKPLLQTGAPTAWDYSYVRWESPPLGVNGKGRVSPLEGVIQTVGTVIGTDGKTLMWNQVAKAAKGYAAIELQPTNPHTTSLQARTCVDCHGSQMAKGYGMDGGRYDATPGTAVISDVSTGEGDIVSRHARPQLQPIKGLPGDFAQLISPTGEQVQTLDSHWPDSAPLSQMQRDRMSREGTCMACHKDMPDRSFAFNVLANIAKVVGIRYATEVAHSGIITQNNHLMGWIKVLGIFAVVLAAALAPFVWRYWRKRRNAHTPVTA